MPLPKHHFQINNFGRITFTSPPSPLAHFLRWNKSRVLVKQIFLTNFWDVYAAQHMSKNIVQKTKDNAKGKIKLVKNLQILKSFAIIGSEETLKSILLSDHSMRQFQMHIVCIYNIRCNVATEKLKELVETVKFCPI